MKISFITKLTKTMHSFLSLMIWALVSFASLSDAIGRNPTTIEHNACRVKYAQYLTQVKHVYKDTRARVIAFNRGIEGHPCMTACRILFRGNTKDMEDLFTPNYVMCSAGYFPRYCMDGRCVLPADDPPSELSPFVKTRTGQTNNNGLHISFFKLIFIQYSN